MRFVLGIIAGALATLFIATAMDTPTDRIVDQLVSAGMDQWRSHTRPETPAPTQTIEQSVESVFTPPTPMETESESDTTQLSTPDPAPDPAPDPDPDPETPAETAGIASTDPGQTPPTPQAEKLTTDYRPASPADAPDDAQQAVVWAPFHSEASARGFATRLTNQLAHPFTVKKTGPANYLVTYDYSDESNRMELEQQIAYVTGAASP